MVAVQSSRSGCCGFLFSEIKAFMKHTVDERNPANHLTGMNPCRYSSGIFTISTGAGFFPHQQYELWKKESRMFRLWYELFGFVWNHQHLMNFNVVNLSNSPCELSIKTICSHGKNPTFNFKLHQPIWKSVKNMKLLLYWMGFIMSAWFGWVSCL